MDKFHKFHAYAVALAGVQILVSPDMSEELCPPTYAAAKRCIADLEELGDSRQPRPIQTRQLISTATGSAEEAVDMMTIVVRNPASPT